MRRCRKSGSSALALELDKAFEEVKDGTAKNALSVFTVDSDKCSVRHVARAKKSDDHPLREDWPPHRSRPTYFLSVIFGSSTVMVIVVA